MSGTACLKADFPNIHVCPLPDYLQFSNPLSSNIPSSLSEKIWTPVVSVPTESLNQKVHPISVDPGNPLHFQDLTNIANSMSECFSAYINNHKLIEGNFIHIPQFHRHPLKNDPITFERHWNSQARIAEQLMLYPDAAIFAESLTENSEDYNGPFAEIAKIFFPLGIPKRGILGSRSKRISY